MTRDEKVAMSLAPAANPHSITCPACSQAVLTPPADGDLAVCPACGHAAHAVLVAEAAWLRTERERLDRRLSWVEGRIAAGDTTPTDWRMPVPSTGAGPRAHAGRPAGDGSPAGVGTGSRPPRPPQQPRPSMTAQTLLLGGGALLLVIASIVFAAVAWDRLGAWGQLGLLTVVVGALASAGHGLRHSYRSTAETLAAIAAAVAAVGFVAAPRLGLGAQWMRDRDAAWGAIAMVCVAALSAGFAWFSRLVAWRLAAIAAIVLAGLASCLAASGDHGGPAPLAVGALAVVGTAVLVSADRSPSDRETVLRPDLVVVGTGFAGVGLILSLTGYGDSSRYWLWALCWALVAAAAAVLGGALPAPKGRGPVAGAYAVGARIVAGVAAAHVPVFVAAAVVNGGRGQVHVPIAALAVVGAVGLVASLLPAVRARRLVPALSVGAATLWTLGLPMLAAAVGDRYRFDEVGGRVDVRAGDVVGYLAVVAVALFAVAVLDSSRWWLGWFAAAVGTAAVWVRFADTDVSLLEAYTLTSAALLLLAGLVGLVVARRSGGELPDTLVVLGPALTMALLPSAVVALGEAVGKQPPTRSVAIIAASALVALAGALLHLRAPLFAGLAALVIAAAGQIYTVSDLVPRWAALAVAGALLVGAGFSFEALAKAGRRVWRYAGELR